MSLNFSSVERSVLKLSSGSLEILTIGTGKPTFLLHGYPETPEFWLPVVMQIPNRKWILPWLPGILGSEFQGDFSLSKAALLLAEGIAAQGTASDFVGFDWGGGLTWFLKTLNIQKLESQNLDQAIVIAAPYPPKGSELIETDAEQARRAGYMRYFLRPDLLEKLLQSDFKTFTLALPQEFVSSHPGFLANAKKAWSDASYTKAIRNYYGEFLSPRKPWMESFTEGINADRLTWLWPENDEFFVSTNLASAVALGIKTSRMPGRTHFSHLSDPAGFAAELQRWLS